MKEFIWDEEKNRKLKEKRGVSFEEIIDTKFIAIEEHNSRKNQFVMFFEYKNYIWVVPCVIARGYTFLKTLFPSRKYTKKYKRGEI